MFNKLRLWLFPTTADGFRFDAVDKDGDGIVQENTPFERKLVSSMAKAKRAPLKKPATKKATKKKTTAKKTTAKKTTAKKLATKKPVKKTTKKK